MEISNKCLDIFYNHILNEVQKGRVDCYFMYNIIFNVQIENNPPQLATKEYQGLIIPNLQIKNKLEFDQLLIEYVQQCLDFYSNNNYPEEILNSEQPVILEFSSNSCPPCVAMLTTLIDIAKNNKDLKVATINVDAKECADTMARYQVDGTPTLMIFEDGEVTSTLVGAVDKDTIMAELK